ncbi:MAG: putative nucleic acid-binding protein [Candidatus Nitrosomirales archaeon]|jgi:predicted nucleic acid-binding protein
MKTYDTRFFFEHYYSNNNSILAVTKNELLDKQPKSISAIVLHEIYKLTLEKEGRSVAEVRASLLEKDFKIVSVTAKIARISAEYRHKYRIPLADSIIAATTKMLSAKCITDDEHLTQIKDIKTSWIL